MRIVKCPACGKSASFESSNKFRPFCSERCQILDLGAWADERYAIPTEDNPSAMNTDADETNAAEREIPPRHHQQ